VITYAYLVSLRCISPSIHIAPNTCDCHPDCLHRLEDPCGVILAGGPNPSAEARKAKGEFLECVQILKEIGESWASGRLIAGMLQTWLLRGDKWMQQGLVAASPQAGVRSYDPPYPPAASSGTAMAPPAINFSGYGRTVDHSQVPSEGPSNLDHQPNPSTDRLGLPSPVYQEPSAMKSIRNAFTWPLSPSISGVHFATTTLRSP